MSCAVGFTITFRVLGAPEALRTEVWPVPPSLGDTVEIAGVAYEVAARRWVVDERAVRVGLVER